MKRNRRFFPVVLVILAGLVLSVVISCNNTGGSTTPPPPTPTPSESYTCEDEDGKKYELIVTGSEYVFKINGIEKSWGEVSKNGKLWTLMQHGVGTSANNDFDVTIDGEFIADIGGPIKVWGEPDIIIGEIVPQIPVLPEWVWYVSDDSQTNEKLATRPDEGSAQTVFAPGGVSYINYMHKKDSNGDWEMSGDEKAKKPVEYGGNEAFQGKPATAYTEGEYTGTRPMDNGIEVEGPIFHIKGTTKVSKDDRGPNDNARFPMVGWGAIPWNKKAKDQLIKAKGYSFWIKVNRTNGDNNWAFVSAVLTDMPEELGWEYKHWFGSWKGASACDYVGKTYSNGSYISGFKVPQNWTEAPAASPNGDWKKITVIMDKKDSKFNMAQDHYIYQYNNTRMRDFKQDTANQVQWQIPLQHQKPTERGGDDHNAGPCNIKERTSSPYDVTHGSFEYDLDFCGFELILK
jgi:hypothetical protein